MADHDGIYGRHEGAFELIRTLLGGATARACRRHYNAHTQEHQLTSRIAEAIEATFNGEEGLRVNELMVNVAVQELPDKGPSSHERSVGADLYISIALDDGHDSFSKGLLVQSKWD